MPDPIDPSNLDGDALTQWYMRSPDEIEQARQKAYAQRYDDFFRRPAAPDPDPGFDKPLPPGAADVDPRFNWVHVSPNRWRSFSADASSLTQASPTSPHDGAVFDKGLAGPDDGAELIDVGNPANPRLRREWERKNGQSWPRDSVTGRNHDVAHIVAKADGGTDTLENIKPLHPDLHRQEHMDNGDFARWGRRAVAPRAVLPEGILPEATLPKGRILPGVLGLFQLAPTITGVLSGRIRHDTPGHFFEDGFGFPDLRAPPPPIDLTA